MTHPPPPRGGGGTLPAIGAFPWMWGIRALCVVVKVTLDLDGDTPTLSKEQARLSPGVPAREGDAGGDAVDLLYPSDFVPFKQFCEIIIGGSVGSPERLCKEAPYSHPLDFDFSVYNSAPPELRRPLPRPGDRSPLLDEEITLAGLSGASPRRTIRFPALTPRAIADATWGPREVLLVCDTLWIDPDQERACLVWRGSVPVTTWDGRDVRRIAFSLERSPVAARPIEAILREQQGGPVVMADSFQLAAAGAPLTPSAHDAQASAFPMVEPPEARLTLDEFAAISAALAEKAEPRARTLSRHAFTETLWGLEEQAWLGRMERDDAFCDEVDAALGRARAAIRRDRAGAEGT